MVTPMAEETLHLVDKLRVLNGQYVNIPNTMNEFTLGTVIKICFGGDFDVAWMKQQWKTLLGQFGM